MVIDLKNVNIIGAGVSGLVLGIYLTRQGYKVNIYEMKKNIGGRVAVFDQKQINNINLYNYFSKNGIDNINKAMWSELKLENIKFKKIKYVKSIKILDSQIDIPVGKERINRFFSYVSPYKKDNEKMRILLSDLNLIYEKNISEKNINKFNIKILIKNININKKIKRYEKMEVDRFLDTLEDKSLREVIKSLVNKRASMMYFIDILLELCFGEVVQIVGGNIMLINSLKENFIAQGGKIYLDTKVKKIEIPSNLKKKIILLENGERIDSDIIACSIDGFHSMIYLLEEKNIPKDVDKLFLNAELFDSYVIINLIVKNELKFNSNVNRYILDKPFIDISGAFHRKFDAVISTENEKTIISLYIRGNYDYWKKSFENGNTNYELNKVLISRRVILEVQKKIKDIEGLIEKVEVITPYDYCIENNIWRGVDRGWIPTPKFYRKKLNINAIDNVYFCGQWVTVGSSIINNMKKSREIAKNICLKDNIKFN